MKRKIGLALSAVVSLCVPFFGTAFCRAQASTDEVIPVEIAYTDVASGKECAYQAYYKDAYFADNEERGQVAKLSMALSAQLYNTAESTAEAVSSMGFTVVTQENYTRTATNSDCNFVVYTIAKKQIGNDTLYGVFMRGTAADAQWYSNFNVGQTSSEHDGFNAAAWEVYNKLGDVISESKENVKIWVTGHSRGGAVANLVGAKLNQSELVESDNLCVYTFASPSTTTKAVEYDNIFNYRLAGDVISEIPLRTWGYSVYGTETVLPETAREQASAIMETWTGNGYNGLSTTAEFVEALSLWTETRDDYYKKWTTLNFNKAPVDIMTEYLVPLLMNQEGYSLSSIISSWAKDYRMLAYIASHGGFVETMDFFASHKDQIVYGHAPVSYLAYLDVYFPHEHEFDAYVSNGDATCTQDGTKTATCFCGETDTVVDAHTALGHDYSEVVKESDGRMHLYCSRGDSELYKNDFTLCVAECGDSFEYFGVPVQPSVVVRYEGNELPSDEYSVAYEENNAVGEGKIVLTGQGEFWGEITLRFRIVEHYHIFETYTYQDDATCTADGTERSVCKAEQCNAVDVRTVTGSATGHTYEKISEDDRSETFACTKGDSQYTSYHLDQAQVKIDQQAFFDNPNSADCLTVGWDDFTISPDGYKVVSFSHVKRDDYVLVRYVLEGQNTCTGRLEGSVKVKYLPDPDEWIVWLVASATAVVGVGAVAMGVMLGIKKRRG